MSVVWVVMDLLQKQDLVDGLLLHPGGEHMEHGVLVL